MSRIALAMIAASLIGSAAPAAPIVVAAPTQSFRDLEYGYQGQDLIDVARGRISAALPVGTPMAQARSLLHRAGASCDKHASNTVRCTATSFEAVEEHLHDVVWTVDVGNANDRVTEVSVTRVSLGS